MFLVCILKIETCILKLNTFHQDLKSDFWCLSQIILFNGNEINTNCYYLLGTQMCTLHKLSHAIPIAERQWVQHFYFREKLWGSERMKSMKKSQDWWVFWHLNVELSYFICILWPSWTMNGWPLAALRRLFSLVLLLTWQS